MHHGLYGLFLGLLGCFFLPLQGGGANIAQRHTLGSAAPYATERALPGILSGRQAGRQGGQSRLGRAHGRQLRAKDRHSDPTTESGGDQTEQ